MGEEEVAQRKEKRIGMRCRQAGGNGTAQGKGKQSQGHGQSVYSRVTDTFEDFFFIADTAKTSESRGNIMAHKGHFPYRQG